MVEAKDQTYRKLREELMRAQKELQLKDQECGKLERVRAGTGGTHGQSIRGENSVYMWGQLLDCK